MGGTNADKAAAAAGALEALVERDHVKTAAGGMARAVPALTQLQRYLVLGTAGGSFYSPEEELDGEVAGRLLEALLLGGPLRDPWPCPLANGEELPYVENRIRHPGDTVDSVYECNLMSKCGMGCKNRVVQLGPTYRLEVFRSKNRRWVLPRHIYCS